MHQVNPITPQFSQVLNRPLQLNQKVVILTMLSQYSNPTEINKGEPAEPVQLSNTAYANSNTAQYVAGLSNRFTGNHRRGVVLSPHWGKRSHGSMRVSSLTSKPK